MSGNEIDIESWISAISTLVIACLTGFLYYENRLLRKAGSTPRVVAHFDINPDGAGGINMSLSNIGSGPALDVSFEIIVDMEDFRQHEILLDTTRQRAPMALIAQGQKVCFLFGITFELFRTKDNREYKPLNPFRVIVKWKAVGSKKVISEEYSMDISQYAGLPGMLAKPPLVKITDELRGINGQLKKISSWEPAIVDLIDATKPDQQSNTRAIIVASKRGQF